MKRYIILMLLSIFAIISTAQERTMDDVKSEVYSFFVNSKESLSRDSEAAILSKDDLRITPIGRGSTTYMYAVNLPEKGWAVVSNEQRYPATILGYSEESHFDTNPDNQPEALKLLLEHHMNMIDSLRESPSTFYKRSDQLLCQSKRIMLQRNSVYALLARDGQMNFWGQELNDNYNNNDANCDKVYNKFCPAFYDVSCGRTLVGCTAVAIAQILWYWRWPDYALVRDNINMAGTQYGTERRHYYDWDNMLPRIDNYTPMYQVDMVAGLLRDCGFTANMLYTSSGSAASVVKLETALSRFHMHWVYNFNYAWTDVASLLINEIQADRPVICQAGKEGGVAIHTFVIDGYNSSTEKFHVNFGWRGWGCNQLWDLGFYGYTVARSFFTELYPDCSFYNPNVTDIGQNLIQADEDVTLYSLHDVSLNQLVVDSAGHLNVSVGETITLGNGFHAKRGSIAKLSPNFNCVTSQTPAPVSAPAQRAHEQEGIKETTMFYVTPNPAKEEIMIHCDVPIEVVYLFSTNGQQVLHTTEEQVNISFLPKGLYILRAITEDGQIHQSKIIHE